jgi:hypothetical protein
LGGIAKNYPAHFFAAMSAIPLDLIRVSVSALLVTATLIEAATPGFLEGHLKIVSPREVELADQTPSELTAVNYSDYPLIVLSRDGKQEVARVTVDGNGNYRVALPPGDYVLDVQRRRRRHVRVKPQPFTILSNQTAHVEMNIDTGVR